MHDQDAVVYSMVLEIQRCRFQLIDRISETHHHHHFRQCRILNAEYKSYIDPKNDRFDENQERWCKDMVGEEQQSRRLEFIKQQRSQPARKPSLPLDSSDDEDCTPMIHTKLLIKNNPVPQLLDDSGMDDDEPQSEQASLPTLDVTFPLTLENADTCMMLKKASKKKPAVLEPSVVNFVESDEDTESNFEQLSTKLVKVGC